MYKKLATFALIVIGLAGLGWGLSQMGTVDLKSDIFNGRQRIMSSEVRLDMAYCNQGWLNSKLNDYNKDIIDRNKLQIQIAACPAPGKNKACDFARAALAKVNEKINKYEACVQKLTVYKWEIWGTWGACENGSQSQQVFCVNQTTHNSDSESKCNAAEKPVSTQPCSSEQYVVGPMNVTQAAAYFGNMGVISNPVNSSLFSQKISRKNALQLVLKNTGLLPDISYVCQNIFPDTPDLESCRIAEVARSKGLFASYPFNGDKYLSQFEMLSLAVRTMCLADENSTNDDVRNIASDAGLVNIGGGTPTLYGDAYIILNTIADFSHNNAGLIKPTCSMNK